MKHATVHIGDFKVPLIGIPDLYTQEKCDVCWRVFHITEIKLDDGRFMCWSCRMKEIVYGNVR